nr:immunoglobulin heavy chain junction region [Macaca mulatta]MOV40624.1 immunoglobulin heavy chain junction region [Macaca mulatta]MOV41238.1 immunoglobulin heavy chain junction region [Macaca mulatta]MOV42687.1 immunoglobulin heavy chain junction region [Macaca mulatta]MOV46881.1 immunoglobulin heavy chain junction region [Macaca mulatta]
CAREVGRRAYGQNRFDVW